MRLRDQAQVAQLLIGDWGLQVQLSFPSLLPSFCTSGRKQKAVSHFSSLFPYLTLTDLVSQGACVGTTNSISWDAGNSHLSSPTKDQLVDRVARSWRPTLGSLQSPILTASSGVPTVSTKFRVPRQSLVSSIEKNVSTLSSPSFWSFSQTCRSAAFWRGIHIIFKLKI